ncbi:MAG: hypothetical protein IJY84_00335 [Clostridia bacterium]|nr:hypothetical protein [Clostridia bacterium]
MPNITITLLTNKRTRQTIDALDVNVVAQAGGYNVVEGENNATEIQVNYPDAYTGQRRYVYMKNAKCEYDTYEFTGSTTSFKLPASMTYAGNTILVFYASSGSGENAVKTVWNPVIVPITATGINYAKVAMASVDVLDEYIRIASEISQAETARIAAEKARASAETTRGEQETVRQNNELGRTRAETSRASAETARASAETARITAENARASAETARIAAEKARASAESLRATAEANRVAEYDALIKDLEDAIVNINAAAENADKVQEIYDQMQITLTYDDEGYPCYVDTTEE